MLENEDARRRGIDSMQADMLESAMGNGWDYVNPEDVGALTEATIISQDGFIGNDGHWYAHPSVKKATVYAHMNYMVENPIETWAEGKTVFFVMDSITMTAAYHKLCKEKYDDANG